MRNRTTVTTIALLAAASLGLAGCDPSSTGSVKSGTPSPSAATASSPATTPSPTTTTPTTTPTPAAVAYLYQADGHAHTQAAITALVAKLAPRCTDDLVGLETAASNTALSKGANAPGAFGILTDLAAHLPAGTATLNCQARLPQSVARLSPKPSPKPTQRPVTHKPIPRPTPTHRVTPRPVVTTHHTQPPVDNHGGATALCNDGTLSFSAHHQGTCSHHHGVAVWYK